jgi:putative glutamine amidotransferase
MRQLNMRVVIAMPRMSTDPEPTVAQSKYIESLARAGAGMHWVELSDPEQAVQDALTCDGLLLPGGGDMDPKFYGQARIPACGEPNLLRDAAEPLLLRAFLAAEKPVLGICRGIQVMNAVLGGDLYQDIKPFEHLPHNDHWAKVHTVTVRRGTLLSRILGQDTVLVNSQHHQAVDRVAPGFTLAALSEDGIVEAIEKPDARFCLGVQWHPEWLSDADPAMQGLFDAFVNACSK